MDWNIIFNFIRDLVLWTIIGVIAYFMLFQWLRVLVGRTEFDADNIVLRIVRVPLIAAIIAYGFVSAIEELHLPEPWDRLATNIYVVILIASAVFLVWRIVKEVVLRWLRHHAADTESRLDDLIVPLIGTVGPLIFFVVGMVAILQYLGVNVAVLATSIGIIGLVLGLAFQDSLGNLFSGIYLMIDPAFFEGDLIQVDNDKVYRVEGIGLRMTRLYDMDSHVSIFIPNNTIAKARISNITKPTIDMKAKMLVTMPCSIDPDRASEILLEVVKSHRHTLDHISSQQETIRRRLEKVAPSDSERAAALFATVTQLEQWLLSDAGDDAAHANLLAVRREMNDRLTEAQAALRALPKTKTSGDDFQKVRHALTQGHGGTETQEIDQNRIARIYKAFALVKGRFTSAEIAPFETALNRLDELDRLENQLENSIAQAEQARENELDRLMSTLVWTGDWVAEELIASGKPKEGARVSLWTRNLAVVYSYSEVEETLDGLDKELRGLIDWVRGMEADGLTDTERARIRTLFGAWGGLYQMEKRRVGELRRRLMRWIEWKEKGILDEQEYDKLAESWDRKLRILSRKLPDTGTDDEETLDNRLSATRKWIHSVQFMEKLDDWKLPTVELRSFDGDKLEYYVTFYIDDIKQQHFEREAFVKSDIFTDLYEACQRENLPIPEVKHG